MTAATVVFRCPECGWFLAEFSRDCGIHRSRCSKCKVDVTRGITEDGRVWVMHDGRDMLVHDG